MNSSIRISLLFVFLWSSSFIAIDLCSAYAEPATFVVVRSAITAFFLFILVVLMRGHWPRRREDFLHSMLVGILLHGVYAGGVFASIYYGIYLWLCALILSLQPILTVILSRLFLAEKITQSKVIGILMGLFGVSIVILEGETLTLKNAVQIGTDLSAGNGQLAISMCLVALLAISTATIVQKRFCSDTEPVPAVCIQYAAAAVFMLPFALMFETTQINWNINFVLGLIWLIVFVSISAMSLLMLLINRGDAGSVANLFYLVTPLVAIQAWVLFDDTITLHSFGGMLLCILGVAIVNYTSAVKVSGVAERSSKKMIFGFVFGNIRVRVDHVL